MKAAAIMCSSLRAIHHGSRPGLVAEQESSQIRALSLLFIYISNQVVLTGSERASGKKCNYMIYFLQKVQTQYRLSG